MADETSYCKHCKRQVPSATFTLHSTHCERFIQVCPSCQEPIPRSQMEQHKNEVHKLVDCKDCKEKVERGAENDHVANHCSKRLIPCGYCEIQCIADTVQDHELACGSRTEMCDICRNHILVRMFKTHEELHKGSSTQLADQLKVAKTKGHKEVLLSDETKLSVPKYRNVVCQNILQASATLPSMQQSKINGNNHSSAHTMEDKEETLLPCEFCGTSYLIESLDRHQMACSWNVKSRPRGEASAVFERPTDRFPTSSRGGSSDIDDEYWSRYVVPVPATKESMVDEEASIPCETCGILLPISCLELHEIACKFANMSDDTEVTIRRKETSTQRPASPSEADDDYWSGYAAVASATEQNVAVEEICIPCENCGTPFPISSLDIHEISCKFSKFSTESENANVVREKTGSIAVASQHDIEPTLLPCSFCNIIISSSILEMHEARCGPFAEQQSRRLQPPTIQSVPKKTLVKNTRTENATQRTLRNNALLATENRLPTTPKIQQSQYAVVQLPNGQEILKKRNPSLDANVTNVGRVLGHGQPQEVRDDGSPIRHTAVYTNRRNDFEGQHFQFASNGWETKKNASAEHREKYSGPINHGPKNHVSGAVPKRNSVQENGGILPIDHSVGMRVTKKPNAAFANYPYQPDSGNKLGGRNSAVGGRPQARNAMAPRTYFRPENMAEYSQQNERDGKITSGAQQNARYHDYSSALGARPKRPQRPADKF